MVAAELSREGIQQRDPHLWFHTEADGSMTIRGRVPAEVGALLKRALEAAPDSLPIPKDVSAETSSEDLHRSRNAGSRRWRRWPRASWQLVPAIASETARRLACDCSVVRIVEDAKGEPLDVGRMTRTIHEGQAVVQTLDDGEFRFVRPDGRTFESPAPMPDDWTELVATHDADPTRITPSTAVTRWTGEALDLDLAIDWLMQSAISVKDVSAEASKSVGP